MRSERSLLVLALGIAGFLFAAGNAQAQNCLCSGACAWTGECVECRFSIVYCFSCAGWSCYDCQEIQCASSPETAAIGEGSTRSAARVPLGNAPSASRVSPQCNAAPGSPQRRLAAVQVTVLPTRT